MNIDPELRQIITRGARDESIEHIKDNPELFETLLEIAMSTDPAAWRATWIVQSTMKKNDARLELYLNTLSAGIKRSLQKQIKKLSKA